jgi:hypothetical protein
MNRNPLLFAAFIVILISTLVGCGQQLGSVLPSATAPDDDAQTGTAVLEISNLEVSWPAQYSPDPCQDEYSAPVLKLCVANKGTGPGSAKQAFILMPAALLPVSQSAILGALPGGDWTNIMPISVTGITLFDESSEGIIIINNKPGSDSGAEGIVIINNIPGSDGLNGIIIINNMPGPDSSGEGIIIINTKEGSQVAGIGIDWGVPPDDSKVGIIIDNIPGPAYNTWNSRC